MPGTKRTHWQLAKVVEIWEENPTVKTYRLQLPDRRPHLAGQHYLLPLPWWSWAFLGCGSGQNALVPVGPDDL